jgi:hypothetical protein
VDEPTADSTFDLLIRARAGDDAARDCLFTRYLPALTRTYEQVALALGKPSAAAARMAVSRALLRLAEAMSSGTA